MTAFSPQTLVIDAEAEIARIVDAMRTQLRTQLRRRGLVLGLSGGIDSSVCAALAARAVGPERVFALFMPENDSDPESLSLGRRVAETFGIASAVEDIGPALAAMGCYERRDSFIRQLVPEFGPGWGCKVVIANALAGKGYAVSSLVVQSPAGDRRELRMSAEVYQGIIAATNMKQRTPNLLEYDQGFFVKNGDGAADLKPIAHLYKSQVYQLAAHLGVPEDIRRRPPTTDTWSMAQSQEEFYFSLPYDRMDLCMYGLNNGLDREQVASAAKLSADQVDAVWADIARKRVATAYLHLPPITL
jgi:NAD+ synthase